MRRCIAVLFVLAALCTVSFAAWAGNLQGHVYTPLGAPFSENALCANQVGGTAYGQATSWAAAPVGWWGMGTLTNATYTIGINEKDDYNRALLFGNVLTSAGLDINIRKDYNNAVTGITWDPYLRTTWSQSFMATGTSIISAGMHQAIEFGPTVYASIHDGTPDGPQIGPTRSFPTVIANAAAAYWSAGEVPTIPGHIYCVSFTASAGHRPFIEGAKIQNANAFPDGRTWRDGVEVNTPMKCVIGQDDDGLVTIMSTKKTGGLGYTSTSCAGISFTAGGTSLLSFSCLVGSTGSTLQATVYEGVGVSGEGANLVLNSARLFRTIDWNNRSMVVWGPGEVPLTPGHTYYIKIKRPDGGPFTIYNTTTKECASTTSYNGGSPLSVDYSTTMTCEAFSGSATMQKVNVSGVNITRGVNSATITWNTPGVTTTDAYLQFGETTPYSYKKMAGNSAIHSVTLNGLKPNTLYHARITCKANGYRDNIGRDFIFVTDPLTTNLVANPGFETGNYGAWTSFVQSGDLGVRNFPASGSGSWFWGVKAHTGTYFFGGACNGAMLKGGAYQKVNVAAGRTLTARAWLWTFQQDQIGGGLDYTVCGQVGIDPSAGTDPNSPNIVWCPLVVAQNLFGDGSGSYTELQVSAMPTSGTVSVFLRAGNNHAMAWGVFGFDDVVLTQEPVLTNLTDLSQVKGTADASYVSIPNLVVTATEAQVGAAYVEASDRGCGIRVESLDTFTVGHTVTLKGYLGTKASGERYIYAANITSDAAGTAVKSLASAAKSIISVGPSNIGKLVTAIGEVKSSGSGYIYINDGSLAGNGLKVMTGSLTSVPAVGKFIGVTGIVQLESTNAPILYPRTDTDVVTYK